MEKKKIPKFPDCCIAAKALDASVGGTICIAMEYNPKTRKHDQIKATRFRDEWKFNLCPYCGRKIK